MQKGKYIPFLVQEANYSGAVDLRLTRNIQITRIGDFSGIILATNGIDLPESGGPLRALKFCESLAPIRCDHALSVRVKGVLLQFLEFRRRCIGQDAL